MSVSFENNSEINVEALLYILREYVDVESELKPFLVKDGVKIIL